MIPIDLSLTEWIKTGQFGFIRIGMTKTELINQMFPPEDWGPKNSREKSPIWRYGNFELHFDKEDQLCMIFNDYIPNLEGGELIRMVDRWIIQPNSKSPTLIDSIRELNRIEVDFSKYADKYGSISITCANGCTLAFVNQDEIEGLDVNLYELGYLRQGSII